ncbi:transposase [Aromatoleum toluolicum]|jgi:transposase|uniref:Transposase n=1 Tax=Aromatoleum toluolicum TaxID=90060 RepID=A0ABX1NNN6_9RHOO|nr:transposase [Aromatoleum toluolicum]NMG00984.1 transposase [Aromatoleum toluolicum]
MDVVIPRRRRRTHSEAFKQSVISACSEPGVSVAGVALANGLNANQVRRWMRERGIEPPSRRTPDAVEIAGRVEPGFVPVQVAPAAEPMIRLEAQRGIARVKLEWPIQAAEACGAWLRDWLA